MNGLPLRTPFLALRHFVPGDAPSILRLNGEPSTRRWLPSHVYADAAEAEAALAFLIASYTAPGDPRRGPYVLAVERAGDARLLGHVGFSPLDDDVEISFAIAESARGRGLGAEAVVHACAWVHQAFGLPGLVANTAHGNVASRHLLERTGFVHVRDETRRFQGSPELVSGYRWQAPPDGVAA